MRLYNQIPKVTAEGKRLQVITDMSCDCHVTVLCFFVCLFVFLQMIVCSATLHNIEVKKLAVCH